MKRKRFTQEEMEILRNNPYTESITPDIIRHTNKFKQEYIRRYLKGEQPLKIFEKLGYDIQILGKRRVHSFDSRVRGLNLRYQQQENDNDSVEEKVDPASIIAKLQHEVTYLRQELEFIKKIIKLENSKR